MHTGLSQLAKKCEIFLTFISIDLRYQQNPILKTKTKICHFLLKTKSQLEDTIERFTLLLQTSVIVQYFLLHTSKYISYFLLAVAPEITYEDKYKEEQVLRAESTLILFVNVSGTPAPTVSWTHGDESLTTTNGVTVETQAGYSRLSIKGVTAANAGEYSVKATNVAGEADAQFDVTVKGL